MSDERRELVEQILKLNPAKTLEVGYLQVRQLQQSSELTDK